MLRSGKGDEWAASTADRLEVVAADGGGVGVCVPGRNKDGSPHEYVWIRLVTPSCVTVGCIMIFIFSASQISLLTLVAFTALLGSVPSFGQLQKVTLKSPGEPAYGPIPPHAIEIPAGEFLELVSTSIYNTAPTFRVDGLRVFPTTGFQVPGPATFEILISDQTPPGDCLVFVSYRLRDNSPRDATPAPPVATNTGANVSMSLELNRAVARSLRGKESRAAVSLLERQRKLLRDALAAAN